MGIGEKIKEYRMRSGLTQKDLADRLHVTGQAVSRWENNEAEPSFDTLRQMALALGCTVNDLFDMSTDASAPAEAPKEPIGECEKCKKQLFVESDLHKVRVRIKKGETSAIETRVYCSECYNRALTVKAVTAAAQQRPVVVQQPEPPKPPKPILALCEKCNKPITEEGEIHRFDERIPNGRTYSVCSRLYCADCYQAYQAEEKRKRQSRAEAGARDVRKSRIHSFIWPTLIFAFFMLFAISSFTSGEREDGIYLIVAAVMGFTFSACCILGNNFIGEMWRSIAGWGFVRLPGVIMEFSIDGILIGIAIKIVLWLLAFALGILTTILATIIGCILSVFVYPIALVRSFKEEKEEYHKAE